ncbi:hypothetical protein [Microbacterium rhizophilus]|uniref:hypothetical protein n=1 Tax=Microbacterium rhizophilus TaxID=3138934 RepID=UPI0031EA698D
MTRIAAYQSLAELPPGVLAVAAVVAAALVALHGWLSRRDPVWLGAIVPVGYLVALVALSRVIAADKALIAGYVTCFIALLVIWWAGEDARIRRRAARLADDAEDLLAPRAAS